MPKPPSLTQISAVAGLAASIATVVALFDPFGDDGGSPVTASPTQQAAAGKQAPAAEGASAEDALLTRVPAAIRHTCTTTDSDWPGARAAVSCPLSGSDGVVYQLFDSVRHMYGAFNPPPDPAPAGGVGAGNCERDWNVESEYTAVGRDGVGRIRCYSVDGKAWIEWTRDALEIYAYLRRDDGRRRALFQAWNAAGPVSN